MNDKSHASFESSDSERSPEPLHLSPSQAQIRSQVLDYYTAATADYRVWSSGFNMHFGYWHLGMNPFRREAMLQELNNQVLQRLRLPTGRPCRLVDLGGGTGATARAAVRAFPNLAVDVVTIVPTQIEMGQRLNEQAVRGGGNYYALRRLRRHELAKRERRCGVHD